MTRTGHLIGTLDHPSFYSMGEDGLRQMGPCAMDPLISFLAGMMFPIFLGLVPLFFLLKSLHLLDSHLTRDIDVYEFGRACGSHEHQRRGQAAPVDLGR